MFIFILSALTVSDKFVYNIYSGTKKLVFDDTDKNLKLVPEGVAPTQKRFLDVTLVKINKNSIYVKINKRYLFAGELLTTIGTTASPVFQSFWHFVRLQKTTNMYKMKNAFGCVQRGSGGENVITPLIFTECKEGYAPQFFQFKKVRAIKKKSKEKKKIEKKTKEKNKDRGKIKKNKEDENKEGDVKTVDTASTKSDVKVPLEDDKALKADRKNMETQIQSQGDIAPSLSNNLSKTNKIDGSDIYNPIGVAKDNQVGRKASLEATSALSKTVPDQSISQSLSGDTDQEKCKLNPLVEKLLDKGEIEYIRQTDPILKQKCPISGVVLKKGFKGI